MFSSNIDWHSKGGDSYSLRIHILFWNFYFSYLTQNFGLFRKMSLLFLFENACLTQSSSSSFFIYNIVINTSTTMNNQLQALNAPKININIFISSFLTHTNHLSFTFSLIPFQNLSFYFKIYKLIKVTQVHDSWSRTSE